MALVSGGRSTLNPNAPLFIPAAFRQVEDFSPEWWQLVKTSKWYHDYWLQQHQDHDNFDGHEEEEDIVDLLPESFDFGFGEDEFPDAFMEPFQPAEPREPAQLSPLLGIILDIILAKLDTVVDLPRNLGTIEVSPTRNLGTNEDSPKKGLEIGADALIKNLNLKSPKRGARSGVFEAAAKHWEKPAQHVSPKCTPRRIQQPR